MKKRAKRKRPPYYGCTHCGNTWNGRNSLKGIPKACPKCKQYGKVKRLTNRQRNVDKTIQH